MASSWLSAPPRSFTVDDFEIGKRPIGRGKFGTVFRVRVKQQKKRILVLKVVDKHAILEEGVKPQLQREVEVHTRLVHPNILRMYAYFTDESSVYLILEWANLGSLYERLQSNPKKRIDENTAARYIRQLLGYADEKLTNLRALQYCHSKNVIHRDVKPENVLLHTNENGEEVVKLADFGWSVAQRVDSRRTTLCGTVEYLPPEVVANSVYSYAFDLWTVGVLAYELVMGVSPFFDVDQDAIMQRISVGHYETSSADCKLSASAADFIGRLLMPEPTSRMTATEALQHPWVQCGGI